MDEIITRNTDQIESPQPGKGLFPSRINRIVAELGEDSELVSIVVQAYNRLEKTRICIESILKYTDKNIFELVLIDNGSTDGTLDYFKSINFPRKQILHVTKNIGSQVPGVLNLLNGRYFAFVCNDTYVTQNWLNNLLTCLRSDDSIGMVVPAISNGSNQQGVDLSFHSLDEMWQKAAEYNVSNPCLWHDRLRLAIQLAIYKREMIDIVGLGDPGFFHDFADDDLVFRIRRAGYRAVLCKDTFVHHDHVIQNSAEKNQKELVQSLAAGKADFHEKYYGLDAWEDVNNYEPGMISMIHPGEFRNTTAPKVLGVDVSCGTPILEIKNKLREANIFDTRLFAFSTDPKYWLDLKTICRGEVVVDRVENFAQYFHEDFFDFIFLGKPINSYPNSLKFLDELLKRTSKNGHLFIKLQNTYDAVSVFQAMGAQVALSSGSDRIQFVNQLGITGLLDYVNGKGFRQREIFVENWSLSEDVQKNLKNLIRIAGFGNANPKEYFNRAMVRYYLMDLFAEPFSKDNKPEVQ